MKREKEKKLFAELNYLYMTEESEKDDIVYQHPLSWRSPGNETQQLMLITNHFEFTILGVNKLIAKADKQHQKEEKKTVTKERVRSVQSTLSPPKNALK